MDKDPGIERIGEAAGQMFLRKLNELIPGRVSEVNVSNRGNVAIVDAFTKVKPNELCDGIGWACSFSINLTDVQYKCTNRRKCQRFMRFVEEIVLDSAEKFKRGLDDAQVACA